MKTTDRDLMLERLDERAESTIRELEAQNEHLEKMNGTVAENCKDIAAARTSNKNLWRVVSGIGLALLAMITLTVQLIQAYYGG